MSSFTGGTVLTWVYFPTVLQWVQSRRSVHNALYDLGLGLTLLTLTLGLDTLWLTKDLGFAINWFLQLPFVSHHTITQPVGTLAGTICAYYWISTSVPLLSTLHLNFYSNKHCKKTLALEKVNIWVMHSQNVLFLQINHLTSYYFLFWKMRDWIK